jgi:putative MATE family efflux protein
MDETGTPAEQSPGIIRDWTQGSILRNLVSLSWPMIVANSLNVLGPTVDMIWVGRLGAADIAAVGIAGMVVMLANALLMGLFTGLRSMIARYVGARDPEGAIHVARQALIISTIVSILMAIIGIFVAEPMLKILGLDSELVILGAPYLRIQFIGMVAMSFRMMSDGTMQASGDTVTPMKLAVIFRALHLGLCPLLVFGVWIFPQMGINGAAITNVFSQSLGTVLGMSILVSGKSRLRLTFQGFRVDPHAIWSIIRIGVPASVMSLQMQIGQLALMRVVVPFGTAAVAAHTLGQRIDMVVFMPLMGLGISAGVLVGQNLGALQPLRAEKNGWVAVGLAQGLMVVWALILFFWAEGVVRIFSSDPSLEAIAGNYLRIAAVAYLVTSFYMILQQCIAGAGDTLPPMLISIVSIWILQIPLAYFLTRLDGLGVYGVRWAMVTGSVCGAIAYFVYFRCGRWKRKRV